MKLERNNSVIIAGVWSVRKKPGVDKSKNGSKMEMDQFLGIFESLGSDRTKASPTPTVLCKLTKHLFV